MGPAPLNAEARRENIRALALAAGLTDNEASSRLDRPLVLTHDPAHPATHAFVGELVEILGRTLPVLCDEASAVGDYAAELVVLPAQPRTQGPHVYAVLREDGFQISRTLPGCEPGWAPHPLLVTVAACYTAGAAIRRAVGEGMPNPPPDVLEFPFGSFVSPGLDLGAPVDLGEAYLAGAGAIGNGLLWAARSVRLQGTLHIVDDDFVSDGNLQRQIWFDAEDIGKSKAERLCAKAQPHFPECRLLAVQCRLQEHPDRHDGPWLRRLIVAVDSRRARRSLQNELPGEVFDASTTGSEEIVLHHNRQPTELACLGCIYPYNEAEVTHEQTVAAHLGVEVETLRSERIDAETAKRICAFHTHLTAERIEGLPFDTLYKQLCSSARLKALGGQQVVAPFGFVSVLAGALLLLEVIRRQARSFAEDTNDWRLSPWRPPVPEMRQRRQRFESCECCGRPELRRVNAMLWGS